MEVIGQHYDVAVIGGGIVGVALAYELLNRRPQLRLALLEKESQLGEHQTGHNSGVLHSGIYYRPGSLKAQLCVEGARRMAELCEARSLPFSRCGKVIVATEEAELPILADLYQRGLANGVPGVQMLEPQQLRAIEPHASGIRAIHCPSTAILDFQRVARELAQDIRSRGAAIINQFPVKRICDVSSGWRLDSVASGLTTAAFINCAGLQADRIAMLSGMTPDVQRGIPQPFDQHSRCTAVCDVSRILEDGAKILENRRFGNAAKHSGERLRSRRPTTGA